MSAEDPRARRGKSSSTEVRRRDFLHVAPVAMAAVGGAAAAWPLIDSMNPSADILALSSIDVDLSAIDLGQRVTVKWREMPLFIVHRTPEEIARAQSDDTSPALIDPETDAERAVRSQWLIMIGVCTHLGCVPLGQTPGDPQGRYGGWFCPCHGSVYDAAGRVRKGPAPRNLDIPPYAFQHETLVRVG